MSRPGLFGAQPEDQMRIRVGEQEVGGMSANEKMFVFTIENGGDFFRSVLNAFCKGIHPGDVREANPNLNLSTFTALPNEYGVYISVDKESPDLPPEEEYGTFIVQGETEKIRDCFRGVISDLQEQHCEQSAIDNLSSAMSRVLRFQQPSPQM